MPEGLNKASLHEYITTRPSYGVVPDLSKELRRLSPNMDAPNDDIVGDGLESFRLLDRFFTLSLRKASIALINWLYMVRLRIWDVEPASSSDFV